MALFMHGRTRCPAAHRYGLPILCALLLTPLTASAAQSSIASLPRIWSGVYTKAQAQRGEHAFDAHCARCHGHDMTGGDGPALIGGTFHRNWVGRNAERMFKKILEQMPPQETSAVSEQEKLDVLAYILEMNGFPSGLAELPLNRAVLAGIDIVGKEGLGPPPSGATVAVAGCLVKDASGFTIQRAQEPTLSSLDDIPPNEVKDAITASPGKLTFRLLDLSPTPGQHVNKKVLGRGLLIRGPENRLNVLHLEVIAPTCN